MRRGLGSGGYPASSPTITGVDEPHSEKIAGPDTFTPGTVVAGKFTLQSVIASGGMGTVFEAWDMFIERRVALKLMHPSLVDDPTSVARFRREAQATARVRHPNVVDVLEVGMRRDGAFYMVQELLTGKTLRNLLAEKKPLPPEQALGLALPIMGGLSAAHAMNIVHRDVKPENIVLTSSTSGEIVPKIVDFGVAKVVKEKRDVEPESNEQRMSITQLGSILGTPHYMAPEQVTGEAVDARADVWAMGVVLYEMLAGSRPFAGENAILVMTSILTREPPRFEQIAKEPAQRFGPALHRALMREVDQRFPTMEAFRDALVELAGGQPRPIFARELYGETGQTIKPPPLADMPEPERAPESITIDVDDAFDEEPEEGAPRLSVPNLPPSTRAPAFSRERAPEMLAKAERALDVNALDAAIWWVDDGLASAGNDEALRGKLWLVSAIAHRWLGDHVAAMKAAQEALARLERGSADWHAALDHAVIAYGCLGRKDRLFTRVDELRSLEEEGDVSSPDAFVVSACRLAYYVLRAGVPKLAAQLTRRARQHAEAMGAPGPFARAWLDLARGELALYEGDLAAHLRRLEAAVDTFTTATDVRHACLARAAIGRAYLVLGAREYAASVLHSALAVAEPMSLDFMPATKAAFGFALAQIGRVDEGAEITASATELAQKRPNIDVESACLLYMARIRRMQSDPEAALSLARKAVEASEPFPGRRAHALAFLANVHLGRGQFDLALTAAVEASTLLERLGGVEEGEPLIRLIHALVLRATGQEAEGRRRIVEARKRLFEISSRFGDVRWEKSFLTQVPDHARLVSVAAQWVGDG